MLKDLFCRLNEVGARWCILRIPPEGQRGDIDLLVDPRHLDLIRQALLKCEFVLLAGWQPGHHYLSYHSSTDHWFWLHIVTELSFGPYSLLRTHAESGCLERRRQNGAGVTLAPDDDFWVTLLHCLVDKTLIAPRHRTHLLELCDLAQVNSPLAQVVGSICPRGWDPSRIIRTVEKTDWTALEQLAPQMTTVWMRKQRVGIASRLFSRLSRLLTRLRYLRRNWGLSVALLGPDGAGKSTLIAGIESSFGLPVRTVYMGLTGGLLPYVDRLRIPLFVIPGRLFIFWCRYLRAKYHQARGRLVLFDRYIYDSVAPTPYPLNLLKQAYRRIDGHAIPAPDLVLLLDAPGTVMYQRKGEYDSEQLENWRQHFLTLRGRLANLEIVDASCSQDTVRADVTNRIWKQYARRLKDQEMPEAIP